MINDLAGFAMVIQCSLGEHSVEWVRMGGQSDSFRFVVEPTWAGDWGMNENWSMRINSETEDQFVFKSKSKSVETVNVKIFSMNMFSFLS